MRCRGGANREETDREETDSMRSKKVSIRGGLMRDMIHDIMETSLGKPIKTGEFRKNPVEPAWVCPSGYEYEIIENDPFKMEYLKPEGVVTGRVVLQLHGGGYIGPMKNIYRKFAVRYSFILSIPAVLGANILSLKDALGGEIVWGDVPAYIVGVLVAAVVGYACIRLLKMIADKGKFGAFAYYCWVVGILTIILTAVKH